MPQLYYGNMEGDNETSFYNVSGLATFGNLVFTEVGRYFISFHITSDPGDYDFLYELEVDVLSVAHVNMVVEWSKELRVTFNEDYNSIVGQQNEYFGAMVSNYYSYMHDGVLIKGVTVSRGTCDSH